MSLRLAGQRVLVTGAGRGIGRAIAHICSEEGAKVAISSRTKSELEETASLAPVCNSSSDNDDTTAATMDIYQADVTSQTEVETMVKSIVDKWGGIDILINNAGGSQKEGKKSFESLSSDDLRSLLDLNVVSVHIVTSAVLRYGMLPKSSSGEGGRIVNISSRAGKVGLPNYSHYVASKFALEGLTASLAEELKDQNISVNSFSPGMVNTRTFPKPPGRKGVRTAGSVRDGLFALLESEVTGHYLHADELDDVREKGWKDNLALKPINERVFSV